MSGPAQSHLSFSRPEADPAVLLAWIETEEDLETIHSAAKVRLDTTGSQLSSCVVAGNQYLQHHRQPGVRKPVLEEGADSDRVRALPRDHEHTEDHQLQGKSGVRSRYFEVSL